MLTKIRQHAPVLSVAAAALTVGLMAPAIGHGVGHALFAHNADKLDNKDSSAFLKSAKVTTTHGGVGWQRHGSGTTPTSLNRLVSGVVVSSDGVMVMALDAPTGFGPKTFGLSSFQLCYNTTGTAIITRVEVLASEVGASPALLDDTTDRSTPSTAYVCDKITVNEPAHKGVGIAVHLSGSGTARLEGVEATWTGAANANDRPVHSRRAPGANG